MRVKNEKINSLKLIITATISRLCAGPSIKTRTNPLKRLLLGGTSDSGRARVEIANARSIRFHFLSVFLCTILFPFFQLCGSCLISNRYEFYQFKLFLHLILLILLRFLFGNIKVLSRRTSKSRNYSFYYYFLNKLVYY